MALCLVGHGHSLTGADLGPEIDKHTVVRMKASKRLMDASPEDYGRKTDIAGGTSASIWPTMACYPKADYWVYIKSKDPDSLDPRDIRVLKRAEKSREIESPRQKDDYEPFRRLHMPIGLHQHWLEEYYSLRGSARVRYSTGMGLLIIAFTMDQDIVLAGYDSILDPDHTEWSSTLATKQYDWENNPPHDFRSENKLLQRLKRHYQRDVHTLS